MKVVMGREGKAGVVRLDPVSLNYGSEMGKFGFATIVIGFGLKVSVPS